MKRIFSWFDLAAFFAFLAAGSVQNANGQLSGKNPCHPGNIKNNPSTCEVMTFPVGFCGACPFGALYNDGRYQDCTRTMQLEDNSATWPTCKAALENYLALNPCDLPRAYAFGNFTTKTGAEKETARQKLDFFLYAYCEAACDCIPQIGADRNTPEISIERGNCQAHPYYDTCNQSPNIKLVQLEGSTYPHPSTLQKVCPKINDWFNSPASDNWPNEDNTYVEPTVVRPFLERLMVATELTKDSNVWNQCFTLESTQDRIEDDTPVATPSPAPAGGSLEYEGCWIDKAAPSRALEHQAAGSFSMQACIDYCDGAGYLYAGIQYRKECWCGDTYDDHGSAPESECNLPCDIGGGICGGTWRMSVYSTFTLITLMPTPPPTPPPTPMPVPSPTPNSYLGCWVDNYNNRAMQLKAPDLWIDDCISHCRNHPNKYPFAAVQYGFECFCGTSYQKHGPAAEEDCDFPCRDGDGVCGGFNRMNVYATTASPTTMPVPPPTAVPVPPPTTMPVPPPTAVPVPPPTTMPVPSPTPNSYLGCWVDNYNNRAMQLKAPDLWIDHCISHCRNHPNKYPFAAVQYGFECFCGTSYQKHGPAAEEDCDFPCRDGDGVCGGFNRMNVYATTASPTTMPVPPPTAVPVPPPTAVPVPPPTAVPVPPPTTMPVPTPTTVPVPTPSLPNGDCYIDMSTNRAMEHKGPNNGIAGCIAYCTNHPDKYPFAAVQYATECFCGFSYEKHGPAPDPSQCNMNCQVGSGVCGGFNRMNVYATGNPLTPVWVDLDENESYIARHECSFVQAGDKFYMFGGRETAWRVDIYDFTSNSWTIGQQTPNKIQLNHFQAVEYQGLIWVIGAFATNSFPNEVPATNIYVYDPARNQWNIGMDIPASRRRGGAGLVQYGGKMYVIGGNTNGHDGGAVEWTDEYDPVLNEWVALQDAPNARDHFSAVVVGNQIYCIGGRATDSDGTYFDGVIGAIDRYTIGSSWVTLGNVALPMPRAAAATGYFGGNILIAGGESSTQSTAFAEVHAFDPATNTIKRVANMNYARHGTQAIVSGGGFFVAGGSPIRGGGQQRNMEVYGSNTPSGSALTVAVLNGPAGSVSIPATSSSNIIIAHTGGNSGAFVNNITLTGPDANLFSLDVTGNLPATRLNRFLIPVGGTRVVKVHCLSYKATTNAFLKVTYGGTAFLSIPLTSQPTPSRRQLKSSEETSKVLLRAVSSPGSKEETSQSWLKLLWQ
jgi:N-acetylneuraminic acid mutarotase